MKNNFKAGLVSTLVLLVSFLGSVNISYAAPLPEEIIKLCPADTIAISHADYSKIAENEFFIKAMETVKSEKDRALIISFYKNIKTITTFATADNFVHVLTGNIKPEKIGTEYNLFFSLYKFYGYLKKNKIEKGLYHIECFGNKEYKLLLNVIVMIDGSEREDFPDGTIVLLPASEKPTPYNKASIEEQNRLKEFIKSVDTSRELWFLAGFQPQKKQCAVSGSFNLVSAGGSLKLDLEDGRNYPEALCGFAVHRGPILSNPCPSADGCKIPEHKKLIEHFADWPISVGTIGFPVYFRSFILPELINTKMNGKIFELSLPDNISAMEVLYQSHQKEDYLRKQSETKIYLKAVYSKIKFYQVMNEQYPASYRTLIQSDDIEKEVFISLFNPKRKLLLKKSTIPEDDFIYRKPPENAPQDWVLLYENLKYHDNRGTNVLLFDGTVKWMNKKELDKQISQPVVK